MLSGVLARAASMHQGSLAYMHRGLVIGINLNFRVNWVYEHDYDAKTSQHRRHFRWRLRRQSRAGSNITM